MGINIERINDDKKMNEEIIFKWDWECDRKSVKSVFKKVSM